MVVIFFIFNKSNDHSGYKFFGQLTMLKNTQLTNQKRSANSFLYIEVKAAQRQQE